MPAWLLPVSLPWGSALACHCPVGGLAGVNTGRHAEESQCSPQLPHPVARWQGPHIGPVGLRARLGQKAWLWLGCRPESSGGGPAPAFAPPEEILSVAVMGVTVTGTTPAGSLKATRAQHPSCRRLPHSPGD